MTLKKSIENTVLNNEKQNLENIHDLRNKIPNLIICGDFNICHKPIDIHNPVRNKNTSGFLPEERDWMDKFIESGFADVFRIENKEPHNYTWWSYRANARVKNLGHVSFFLPCSLAYERKFIAMVFLTTLSFANRLIPFRANVFVVPVNHT